MEFFMEAPKRHRHSVFSAKILQDSESERVSEQTVKGSLFQEREEEAWTYAGCLFRFCEARAIS